MLDLGLTFCAAVERDPHALALIDGDQRLTYAAWFQRISALLAGFDELGLVQGDRLVSLLQNRWQAATLHWACQFAGIVITPINWRVKADELDYCLQDAAARALVYESVAAAAVAHSRRARALLRIVLDAGEAGVVAYGQLVERRAGDATPRGGPEHVSVMFYTSGTTGPPKGVPRRQRAERAAALAHVAQTLYCRGERTLGVMPLYHTMGVRSLLAMALVGGVFVCEPRFEALRALELIATELTSHAAKRGWCTRS